MITLLAKFFIKAKPDTNDVHMRSLYGLLCGSVGIALNLLLVLGKLFVGMLSGSIAIIADAINNLSDAASSVITLVGFIISRKKPDEEHPYGHGRMEYVAALFVSIAILLVGIELARVSIEKIIAPTPATFSILTIIVLLASILIKVYMTIYNHSIAKRIDSAALKATSKDSLYDVISTSAVLVSVIVSELTGLQLDGWFGLLVSIFIFYGGLSLIIDTIKLLLGKTASPKLVSEIEAIVMSNTEIIGMHDLMVHDYGPGNRIVMLHAEVSANSNLLELHDTIDNIEKELMNKLASEAVIHMDPIDTNDERTNKMRESMSELVRQIDEDATIHDFRMVSGPTHTNLIFDISIPYSSKLSEKDIREEVEGIVTKLDGNYFAVLTVDRC